MSERFYVEGGARLEGEVEVSGAKNAALKFVAVALLAPGKTVLHGVPRIKDIWTMISLLDELGVKTSFSGHTLKIDALKVDSYTAPYEFVRQINEYDDSATVMWPPRIGLVANATPSACRSRCRRH